MKRDWIHWLSIPNDVCDCGSKERTQKPTCFSPWTTTSTTHNKSKPSLYSIATLLQCIDHSLLHSLFGHQQMHTMPQLSQEEIGWIRLRLLAVESLLSSHFQSPHKLSFPASIVPMEQEMAAKIWLKAMNLFANFKREALPTRRLLRWYVHQQSHEVVEWNVKLLGPLRG